MIKSVTRFVCEKGEKKREKKERERKKQQRE